MARYILIEVDNNATAERLRAQIDNAGEAKGMRVVGMFAKTSKLCSCPKQVESLYTRDKKVDVRGAKFGWWLCCDCHLPKNGAGQTLRNLLDAVGTPTKYRDLWLSVRWRREGDRVVTIRSASPEDWK
jgi:hypothetical protein